MRKYYTHVSDDDRFPVELSVGFTKQIRFDIATLIAMSFAKYSEIMEKISQAEDMMICD